MNPTLVPTLAELQIELQRAIAVQIDAVINLEFAEVEGAVTTVFEDAVLAAQSQANSIIHQIAGLQVSSLPDMRVKAFALRWLYAKPGGVERFRPEHRLAEQIVIGLLNEEIA